MVGGQEGTGIMNDIEIGVVTDDTTTGSEVEVEEGDETEKGAGKETGKGSDGEAGAEAEREDENEIEVGIGIGKGIEVMEEMKETGVRKGRGKNLATKMPKT